MSVDRQSRRGAPSSRLWNRGSVIRPPSCGGSEGSPTETGAASLVVVVAVEDQLGLGDDGDELAVAAGDARLQHDGGAAAVQRHADGVRGVALRHAGKEIGLALD